MTFICTITIYKVIMMKNISTLLLMIFISVQAFAADVFWYQDEKNMRDIKNTFCNLQISLGHIINNKLLDQNEADEANQLLSRYNDFRTKYKSTAMNTHAWGEEVPCLERGKTDIEYRQKNILANFEVAQREFKEGNRKYPILSVRQCKVGKEENGIFKYKNESFQGDINSVINEHLGIIRRELVFIERRLPKKLAQVKGQTEDILPMSKELKKLAERNKSNCLVAVQDEKGWRLEPLKDSEKL